MKSLFAKIALNKTIGLYLGEHEVAMSQMAATLLGPVEAISARAPCVGDDWAASVTELLTPLLSRRRRISVAIGVPTSRLFFVTRPLIGERPATPEDFLQKAISSPNINVKDLTVDLHWNEFNKSKAATMAACRKRYVNGLLSSLSQWNVRLQRIEPAPCALVRAAAMQRRFPRGARKLVCIFLGAAEGLAVLVSDRLPVAWRAFALPEGGETTAIVSAARTLRTQQTFYGLEVVPQYAIVCGRPELHERLKDEQLPSSVETRVLWHAGPAFEPAAIAQGLAFGCMNPESKAFDLSRGVKPPLSFLDIIPWGDVAFTSILVGVAGLALGAHATKLDGSFAVAQTQRSRYKCATNVGPEVLAKEAKDLKEKLDTVHKFVDSRVAWSAYTADLAARLPKDVLLDSFSARSGLGSAGRGGTKGLTLAANAPMSADGSAPREIDTFLNSLRNDPVILADFASAELTGIKPGRAVQSGGGARASFGIVGVPKRKGAAKAAPAAKGKK
ncbi:MAG: hypothetical protein ABFC96_04760 [Thermoguttaceae bacterium]